MKAFPLTLALCLLTVCLLSASPRRTGAFNFPRDDSQAPRADATLQQDAVAQKDRETAEAIRLESESGPRLTERQNGETFAQYRERLEVARERLKHNKVSSEELKESQEEALYEAEYQLRKDTFYAADDPMFGQGAGEWGITSNQPLEVQRVIRLLEAKREAEALAANSTSESSTATLDTPVNDHQREEGTQAGNE
ncbi:MAG: hypothetical protein ACQKBW_07960 [Puniceicoccales bacterium]